MGASRVRVTRALCLVIRSVSKGIIPCPKSVTYRVKGWHGLGIVRAPVRHRRQVTVVREVRARSGVRSNTRRSLGGRRLLALTSALRADTSEQRGGWLLVVGLADITGRASMARSSSTISGWVRGSRLTICHSRRSCSAGTGASASFVRLGSVRISRGIGVDKAASLAVWARPREPEGLLIQPISKS